MPPPSMPPGRFHAPVERVLIPEGLPPPPRLRRRRMGRAMAGVFAELSRMAPGPNGPEKEPSLPIIDRQRCVIYRNFYICQEAWERFSEIF
jgi:hypothetical protein